MNSPLVSVLIPCYNVERYVENAVISILKQTYANLEVIIINDGSTDYTSDILKALLLKDNRIIYIENAENKGLIYTLNRGLKLCSGKYIARMDADDYSFPKRIEKQVKFLEKHLDTVCISAFPIESYRDGRMKKRYYPISDTSIRMTMLYSSPFVHPCIMMRTDVIKNNSICFEEKDKYAEDYLFWSKLLQYGKGYNIPRHLLLYRVLPSSQTAIGNDDQQQRYEIISSIQQYNLNMLNITLTDKERKLHYLLGNSNLIKNIDHSIYSANFIATYFRRLSTIAHLKSEIGEKIIKIFLFNPRYILHRDTIRLLMLPELTFSIMHQIQLRVKSML